MGFQSFLKRLGRNLREARTRAGFRQVDVSEKAGLSYRHYQNIEAGRVNITVETLCRLSRLFNASVKSLIDECE